LRKDLPELVAFASELGMRTNLITNGIRCSDRELVSELKKSGLNSAQVSLEGDCGSIHDSITGLVGSFESTVAGIMNLKDTGIYTHTNSTICRGNMDHLVKLVTFIKETFSFPYLSMNMVIKTGITCDNDNVNISYSSISEIIAPVIKECEALGIKLVWYSPTPYCLFNPVDKNLGSKSCACVSGLLSVNPYGEILPCSSYNRGIGSLLTHSFGYIWNSDEALYYRERKYQPPVCSDCEYHLLCGGACPLYWENAGSFSEIETVREKKPHIKNALWKFEKKIRVKSKGIKGIKSQGGKDGKS
jgi:radical SAM protein with 4Fe4S-binding SPASM domain